MKSLSLKHFIEFEGSTKSINWAIKLLSANRILNKIGLSLILVLEGTHCFYSNDSAHFELERTNKFFDVTKP